MSGAYRRTHLLRVTPNHLASLFPWVLPGGIIVWLFLQAGQGCVIPLGCLPLLVDSGFSVEKALK